MIRPEIPKKESERLKDLLETEILDTKKELDFDNITELASSLLDFPISIISMIDENRQWFKSSFGFQKNITETSRNISFCGHAINTPNKATIIPDARKDERFKDNPLVLNGTVISYVGIPIISAKKKSFRDFMCN
jgi:GAF domain-containing protein